MSKFKRSDSSASETQDVQQNRTLQVVGYLQHLALPSVFNRELTEADYDLWGKILAPYPPEAIDYAFDNWGRNGKQWPKPSNILELIGAWNLSKRSETKTTYEHHGTGYGENDVTALWKLFREKYPNQKKRLTYEQRQDLIDELDARRKSA